MADAWQAPHSPWPGLKGLLGVGDGACCRTFEGGAPARTPESAGLAPQSAGGTCPLGDSGPTLRRGPHHPAQPPWSAPGFSAVFFQWSLLLALTSPSVGSCPSPSPFPGVVWSPLPAPSAGQGPLGVPVPWFP